MLFNIFVYLLIFSDKLTMLLLNVFEIKFKAAIACKQI